MTASKRIPPLLDELFWLPLSHIKQPLLLAYQRQPDETFPTIQLLAQTHAPGGSAVLNQLLPALVLSELAQLKHTEDFTAAAQGKHERLTWLLTRFQQLPTARTDDLKPLLQVLEDLSRQLRTIDQQSVWEQNRTFIQALKVVANLPVKRLYSFQPDAWADVKTAWRRAIESKLGQIQRKITDVYDDAAKQLIVGATIADLANFVQVNDTQEVSVASDSDDEIRNPMGLISTSFQGRLAAPQSAMQTIQLFDKEYALDDERTLIFPRLAGIADSVSAVEAQINPLSRARSLERIAVDLDRFDLQLESLRLSKTSQQRWQSVVQHWRQVVGLTIEQLYSQATSEVQNAFVAGNPLDRNQATLFRGREREFDEMVRLILDRSRPTIVVYGPRRFGKSSFLLQLPRFLPSDTIYAYESAQKSSFRENDSKFCYGLARAIERDCRANGLKTLVPQAQAFNLTPFSALDEYLDAVETALGDYLLIIALDEFELIGKALVEQKLSSQVLDQLRYMIQHRSKFALIFSGVSTLEELGPNWTSYFISVQPLELLYLEPVAARKLLEAPIPEFKLTYEEGVVEQILVLTRCQPYLLQAMGASMVNLANRERFLHFPLARLEAAVKETLGGATIYFQELWNNYTGTNPAEVHTGRAILRELTLQKQPLEPVDASERTAFRYAMARMRRYHLIELASSGYQIEVPLFARWITERAIDD